MPRIPRPLQLQLVRICEAAATTVVNQVALAVRVFHFADNAGLAALRTMALCKVGPTPVRCIAIEPQRPEIRQSRVAWPMVIDPCDAGGGKRDRVSTNAALTVSEYREIWNRIAVRPAFPICKCVSSAGPAVCEFLRRDGGHAN